MLFQAIQQNQQQRANTTITVGDGSSGFLSWLGASTKKGVNVNDVSAFTLSAFYNGINILCNDYAKLPKGVYQKTEKGRFKINDHALSFLISKRPNQYMSAFNFDAVMMKMAILKGNAYAEIIRNSFTGQIEAIQLIDQYKTPVVVVKSDEKLFYRFDNRVLSADDIIHVPGFSFNGITGIGVVTHAAQSLGVALSSQEFAEEYYASKGVGTAVVTTSKSMDNEAKKRYSSGLSTSLTNNNAFKVAVVDEAGSFQHIKLTPQESMFLESNKHAIEEVARWLNIPSFKLKSTENTNYSNMEIQAIGHVADSILPWKIKFEQEYDYKCFNLNERANGFYTRFDTGILLLADKKTQAEYYSKMISASVYTPNQVRNKEEMNSIDGLDQIFVPVNMQTLEQINLNIALKNKELQKTD